MQYKIEICKQAMPIIIQHVMKNVNKQLEPKIKEVYFAHQKRRSLPNNKKKDW